ncbi:hypothetical protein ABE504_08675 [Paenibacillus oryzisoli]
MPKIKRKPIATQAGINADLRAQDLMETQSEATLRKWCLDFAEKKDSGNT